MKNTETKRADYMSGQQKARWNMFTRGNNKVPRTHRNCILATCEYDKQNRPIPGTGVARPGKTAKDRAKKNLSEIGVDS